MDIVFVVIAVIFGILLSSIFWQRREIKQKIKFEELDSNFKNLKIKFKKRYENFTSEIIDMYEENWKYIWEENEENWKNIDSTLISQTEQINEQWKNIIQLNDTNTEFRNEIYKFMDDDFDEDDDVDLKEEKNKLFGQKDEKKKHKETLKTLMDNIMDKINTTGIESLSVEEKEFLDKNSKNYKDK